MLRPIWIRLMSKNVWQDRTYRLTLDSPQDLVSPEKDCSDFEMKGMFTCLIWKHSIVRRTPKRNLNVYELSARLWRGSSVLFVLLVLNHESEL